MRAIVRHGPNQQLLARELVRRCQPTFNFRIDDSEADGNGGPADGLVFQRGMRDEYLVLVIDDQAILSGWIDVELGRILDREKAERRRLMTPVVLSQRAWEGVAERLGRDRDCVRCHDQQDRTIDEAARALTKALVDWLIGMSGAASGPGVGFGDYASAESMINNAARALKAAIYPYRQSSPGTVPEIFARVSEESAGVFADADEMQKALTDLIRQGRMDGYYFDGEQAFVFRERFHDKTSMNTALKQRLAKRAASLVSDDQKIAIDGGTTTLAVARELCMRLGAGSLFGIKVVTNSLPSAQAFLDALALKNAGDRDAVCRIELIGGPCRVSTLCTTTDDKRKSILARQVEGVDIAFIGASGLVDQRGFGVTNVPEIAAKEAFQAAAAKAVVVCDHTKFEVTQLRITNPAEEKMTIVTDAASERHITALRAANRFWDQVEVLYCG